MSGRLCSLPTGLPDLCLVVLRLAGWVAVTLLAAAGCLVLFFAMLGGFTAQGFFTHLDNLASRFVAADQVRRAAFLSSGRDTGVAVIALVAVCRWRSLRASLARPQEPARG